MSTDNLTHRDQDFSTPSAPQPVATDQSAAAEAPPNSSTPETDQQQTGNHPADPSHSEAVAPAPTEESEHPATAQSPPRRKFELRPTINAEEARAIPSLGGSSSPVGSTGPIPIPSTDDAEVEEQIAHAITGITAEDQHSVPAVEAAEPVALPENESIEASLEAAIEAAMSGGQTAAEDSAGVLAPVDLDTLPPGQKLQGTVQAVHEDSVFLDFGLRLTGVVPFRQFNAKKPPQVGDKIDVVVDKVDDNEGLILTNLPRGTSRVQSGNWDAVSPDQVVECMVTKTNKGGLEVSLSSLRGFIPASQVELGYVADLEQYVGQKLRAKIVEVNPAKRKLVLSRRSILAEERESAKLELLNEIKPDQVRTGLVKTVKEYGAFVDLGGMDGFLPVAQMSWVRIEHPSEILTEGQQIEVKVLSVDREKNRVSLGMRQLAPNPWRLAETKYAKGTQATGRVTRVEAFGAFVELEPGVEGLVHISELDHRRVKRVTEVLNVGDMAEVQILEVDPKKKRIGLSVKALKAKPEPEEKPKDEDLAPGKGQSFERQRKEPLKGGTGDPNKRGGLFGNPRDFGSS